MVSIRDLFYGKVFVSMFIYFKITKLEGILFVIHLENFDFINREDCGFDSQWEIKYFYFYVY